MFRWSKDKNKMIANTVRFKDIIPNCFKDVIKQYVYVSKGYYRYGGRRQIYRQSQSLNLFMAAPDPNKLTSMHLRLEKRIKKQVFII